MVVSKGCSLPSVAQHSRSSTETVSRRFCAPVIGPSSLSSLATASLPPATESVSGGSSLMTMNSSTADIISAQGAPAISHSIQLIRAPSSLSMKPTSSRFCAAAVWMPMFQMLVPWATMIIIPAAKLERLSTPNAAMMPIMIGTTQALRAVALGTTRLSRMVTRMVPARMCRLLVPTFDRVTRAMRRSSPVWVIAAAMNSAPATSASAGLEKPASAMPIAAVLP